MKATELRELSIKELNDKFIEGQKKLLDLRFKKAKGELKNILSLREARRDIARILTIIREKARKG